jgi:hypothetical protein
MATKVNQEQKNTYIQSYTITYNLMSREKIKNIIKLKRNLIMADTIGDLIDKLSIINIRLWNLEDARRDYSNSKKKKTEAEVKVFLNKISMANKERNSLIDQINGSLGVLIDKAAKRTSSLKIVANDLLGTGKNKYYKTEK